MVSVHGVYEQYEKCSDRLDTCVTVTLTLRVKRGRGSQSKTNVAERGSNENLNGLVIQYISKSAGFMTISNESILEIHQKINSRPRKRFGYENPIFVMEKLVLNPKVTLWLEFS
jgi:hypothetical protein